MKSGRKTHPTLMWSFRPLTFGELVAPEHPPRPVKGAPRVASNRSPFIVRNIGTSLGQRVAVVCAIFSLALVAVCAPAAFSQTLMMCTGGPNPTSLDANASAEIYDPQTESFEATGSMTEQGGRSRHSAELLPDGKVLILGGMSEGIGSRGVAQDNLYDPGTGVFSLLPGVFDSTNSSTSQTVTQFQPGRLLIVGRNICPASSVFDYAAPASSGLKFPLMTSVAAHSATRLVDGSVLIAGGYANRGKCGSGPGLGLDRGASFQLTNDWKTNPWSGWILSAAEVFQPSTSGFVAVGSMSIPRIGHTATLLKSGQVLIAGGFTGKSFTSSCEIFDPRNKTFHPGPSMHEARIGHSATLLGNGEVLIAGGFNGKEFNKSAELYNPETGTFEMVGMLKTARESATATLLPNETVLVAGGHNTGGVTQHCELFDPQSKHFRVTADLINPRYSHSATLLSNGKVLVAGGGLAITPSTEAGEVFDPATARFSGVTSLAGIDVLGNRVGSPWARLPDGQIFEVYWGPFATRYEGPPVVSEIRDLENGKARSAAPMNVVRKDVTVTSLQDGRVLVAGGFELKAHHVSATAELYDVRSNRFIVTGRMTVRRTGHAAIALKDGRVLIVGGSTQGSGGALASAELYNPLTGKFSRTGSMTTARQGARAAVMSDGRVLVVGGSDASGLTVLSGEVYDPVSGTFSSAGKMMSSISPDIVVSLSSGAVLVIGEPPIPPMNCHSPQPPKKSEGAGS
jgi:hypothetical protein